MFAGRTHYYVTFTVFFVVVFYYGWKINKTLCESPNTVPCLCVSGRRPGTGDLGDWLRGERRAGWPLPSAHLPRDLPPPSRRAAPLPTPQLQLLRATPPAPRNAPTPSHPCSLLGGKYTLRPGSQRPRIVSFKF